MIGDDDFFMQNADYHYGASDSEKMYGRSYDDASNYSGSYGPSSQGESGSTTKTSSKSNDDVGKYCLIGLTIFIAIIVIAGVIVPLVSDAMAESVTIEDLKITRYIDSRQYDSQVSTDKGYEITYKEKSYGEHYVNLIFYSKNGELLYNGSDRIEFSQLGDVPYYVYFKGKADYAIFEVYKNPYGKCIYSERVKVDNKNVKKNFINYDTFYY